MRRALFPLLILVLAAGCGGQRDVLLDPAAARDGYPLRSEALRRGDELLLELRDGRTLRGRVRDFPPDSLVLDGTDDLGFAPSILGGGYPEHRIALADIRAGRVERRIGPHPLLPLAYAGLIVLLVVGP